MRKSSVTSLTVNLYFFFKSLLCVTSNNIFVVIKISINKYYKRVTKYIKNKSIHTYINGKMKKISQRKMTWSRYDRVRSLTKALVLLLYRIWQIVWVHLAGNRANRLSGPEVKRESKYGVVRTIGQAEDNSPESKWGRTYISIYLYILYMYESISPLSAALLSNQSFVISCVCWIATSAAT